jgi:hypothetical protein
MSTHGTRRPVHAVTATPCWRFIQESSGVRAASGYRPSGAGQAVPLACGRVRPNPKAGSSLWLGRCVSAGHVIGLPDGP